MQNFKNNVVLHVQKQHKYRPYFVYIYKVLQ